MPPPAIVVIGASAGGVEALRLLVVPLDSDIPAALFVVLHVPSRGTSVLPAILQRAGRLPAAHAVDGDRIVASRIYVAPPDFHLLLQNGTIVLQRGPQEHGTRPAVDPLFRTAAAAYGERVLGVVLSGTLDDGTSGLLAIKRHGGQTLVQDPQEALHGGMPRSAIATVDVDHVLSAAAIGTKLNELARGTLAANTMSVRNGSTSPRAEGDMPETMESEQEGTLAGISCPHCGGSLWEVDESGHIHFRCRIGHQYGTESLLDSQSAALEAALWTALRALEESSATARHLASRMAAIAPGRAAERHLRRAAQAEEHASVLRRVLQASDSPVTSE